MPGIRVKPWNRVDGPIYSLATTADGKGNLNICSYVTPIAMKPKRFIIGVYKDTKTLANLEANPIGLLNYMAKDQANHIKLLGKKSGHSTDKIAQLGDQIEHVGEGLFHAQGGHRDPTPPFHGAHGLRRPLGLVGARRILREPPGGSAADLGRAQEVEADLWPEAFRIGTLAGVGARGHGE